MKLAKRISAAVLSLAMVATMAVSASAATKDEVVQAAKDNGVQAHNVKQLENFLKSHNDKFTDAERDEMVKAIADAGEIVKKYTDKDLASLEESERDSILSSMTEEDKKAVLDKMVDMGAKVKVKVTYEKSDANFGYDVYATYIGDSGDGSTSGTGDDNGNKQDTTKKDNLPNTGDVNSVNSVAVVMAAMAIVLAGTGIVVVAKKNKEN